MPRTASQFALSRRVASVARHMTSSSVFRSPEFAEDQAQYVQLTPSLPAGAGSCAAVVQGGRYDSNWIRVRTTELSVEQLGALVDEAVACQKGPTYVGLPEAVAAAAPGMLATVLKRGLHFHHFHPGTNEFVYYKWCHPGLPDMVPGYATSIEGQS